VNLYIAYGTTADHVTALRLQALAAVNGLNVYVPPVFTRETPEATLDPRSNVSLMQADAVLGVLRGAISETCRHELNLALSAKKNPIVMAEPALAKSLQSYFPGRLVVVDPAQPARAEGEIVQMLKKTKMEQENRKVLIALGTLALGLLLFAPAD
jgi:hypothetical protein